VQFDDRIITRLRVRRSNAGLEVLSFDMDRGPWGEGEDARAKALQGFVEKHGIVDDAVYTVLPRHEITTRIIDLPSDSEEEIEGMVRFSAEEYVPFAVDELLIDECILYKTPGGESRVLAAFAHRDVVYKHMALLQQAGVVPERVFLSTACLASAAAAARPEGGGDYAVIHMAIGGVEGIVIDEKGHLTFGRAVAATLDWQPGGDQHAEALEELTVETRATLAAFRRESLDGIGADRVFLAADVADAAFPTETMENDIGKPCAKASFVNAFINSGQEKCTHCPLAALGAALIAQGRGAVVIDLLPESVTEGRQLRQVRKRLLQGAGVAALIVAAIAVLFAQHIFQRQAYLNELNLRLQAKAGQAEGIREKREQLQILRREVQPKGSLLQYLAMVCQVAPEEGLNVLEFEFKKDASIDIRGRAESLDVISRFGQSLRDLGQEQTLAHFLNAARKYENENVRERDQLVWEYHYSIPFNAEEQADAVAAEIQ
jgi:hypothetical protein